MAADIVSQDKPININDRHQLLPTPTMTTFEHREIRGITIKNMIVTIASTISIVVSVMTGYFQLKGDIKDIRSSQETQSRINEIRLKVLEGQVNVLQQEVQGLKEGKRS